jgi:hypothetical protein
LQTNLRRILTQIALSRLAFFPSARSLVTLAQLTTFVFPFHKFMFEAYNGVPRRVSIRQFAMPLVFLVVVLYSPLHLWCDVSDDEAFKKLENPALNQGYPIYVAASSALFVPS